ncbi:hypothetical protein [Streptomyces sp. 6N106]|uniref:hypothetical protein n=1 Tax=Streptomyces sp. 6N106 TaxID=3457418 RepID=UPI003FD48C1F
MVGSGTDETCDQVAARLAEAAQAARAVRDAALAEPAARVPGDGFLVANPLPWERTALVKVDVMVPPEDSTLVSTTVDGSAHPVQLISQAPTVLSDERLDASQLERVLRRIHRRELFGRLIDHYEIAPGSLVFHLAEASAGPFDLLILRREVAAAAAAHPGEWRVRTLAEARATALVPVHVPAGGLADTFTKESLAALDKRLKPADQLLDALHSEGKNTKHTQKQVAATTGYRTESATGLQKAVSEGKKVLRTVNDPAMTQAQVDAAARLPAAAVRRRRVLGGLLNEYRTMSPRVPHHPQETPSSAA